jgi:WD40 repeat protein
MKQTGLFAVLATLFALVLLGFRVVSGEGIPRPKAVFRAGRDRVSRVGLSPDNRLLAAHCGNSIRVWDIASGKLTQTLRGYRGWVWAMAFSSDGKRLAMAGDDSSVRLWDVLAGATVTSCRGHTERVDAIAFHPRGTLLVTGSDDQSARVWDATSGAEKLVYTGNADKPHGKTGWVHGGQVGGAAFSPDGKRVASASSFGMRNWKDGHVKVWEAATGKEVLGIDEAADRVTFDPSGHRLATTHWGGLTVWDAATGQRLSTFPVREGDVESMAFTPGGRCIAAVCCGNTVKVWDTAGKKQLLCVRGNDDRIAVLSQDARLLAYSPDGWRVEVWEIPGAKGKQGCR